MITSKKQEIKIREANINDAEAIAKCLLLAMRDIVYAFVGTMDPLIAESFMYGFARREDSQYSYRNCWVAESQGEVVGVANVYDGGMLDVLRRPVFDFIKKTFNKEMVMADETEAGEYYIDCIGVDPHQQGKGIGTLLLKFLIEEFALKRKLTLGLLVDEDNPKAKQLYSRLGFKVKGDKWLLGKRMEHLQLTAAPNL